MGGEEWKYVVVVLSLGTACHGFSCRNMSGRCWFDSISLRVEEIDIRSLALRAGLI